MRTAAPLVILAPLVFLTSALTTYNIRGQPDLALTTGLDDGGQAPPAKPVCPVFQNVMSYNTTNRQLSAFSYVEPLTLPKSLTSFSLKPTENATLTTQVMPARDSADNQTTIKFDETQRIHVGGTSKLLDNPIFGSWIVNENTGNGFWAGGECGWVNVVKYLQDGGAGLRIKRKNLSTLTVDDLDKKSVSYTAESAANEWLDNELILVFTDALTLEISQPWANTIQLHITSTAFWPDESQDGAGQEFDPSKFAICYVTKASSSGISFDSMDYFWSLRGESITRPGYGCKGMIYKQDILAKPPTPAPTPAPTASNAVKATAQVAIVLGLFVAVSLLA